MRYDAGRANSCWTVVLRWGVVERVQSLFYRKGAKDAKKRSRTFALLAPRRWKTSRFRHQHPMEHKGRQPELPSRCGDNAELLHHFQRVVFGPAFHRLAALKAVDGDGGHLDSLASCGNARIFAAVRAR